MDINTGLPLVSQFPQWIKTASLFTLTVRSEQFIFSIFSAHVSPGSSVDLIFLLVLLANTCLGFGRLLCVMVWFLDELFHNSCHERMTCCLIHVMSE